MRTCERCGSETVQTERGKAVCDACRKGPIFTGRAYVSNLPRTCAVCGRSNIWKKRVRFCDECKAVAPPTVRKRKLLRCENCGKSYVTTGGNRTCDACRNRALRHPCPDCGTLCDHRAERCRDCARRLQIGDKAPSWRGGRRHNVRGYVMVTAPIGHPAAAGGGRGYVREHVLVMEARLGRYMLPGETVHHVNGVKDDNRDENLELWVKSQPAGQRTSDLVAWAREIIATYGPLGDNEPPPEEG